MSNLSYIKEVSANLFFLNFQFKRFSLLEYPQNGLQTNVLTDAIALDRQICRFCETLCLV